VYMPQVSKYLTDEQHHPISNDHEFDDSKPELWPLFLPSQLSQEDRSSCHNGVAEIEHTLRLAQVQDNLVDLRRLRRTLRSLRTYFRSNVVGEGQKTQTKSRTAESGVAIRIHRTVKRYRLAYAALLSMDPTGDWRKEFLELTDKDNRGPGKEQDEQGVGDGRYAMSWIWRGSLGGGSQGETEPSEQEVNETVRHEWMTCRARADRWKEEAELLQEEMRRIIAFLEWKSTWWGEKVGSRLGSVTADVQHGVDSYARKQANVYHRLAASLAGQWIPHLLASQLDISWAKTYSWASEITSPVAKDPRDSSSHRNPPSDDPSSKEITPPSGQQHSAIEPTDFDNNSGDEGNNEDIARVYGDHDEGESSDGVGIIGFEYDDEYM
jgi:hypothetical protein